MINRLYTIERNSCLTLSMEYAICKFLISFAIPLFPTLHRDSNTSFFYLRIEKLIFAHLLDCERIEQNFFSQFDEKIWQGQNNAQKLSFLN